MTLNIAICDDTQTDRAEVNRLLNSYAFNRDYDFHIEEFENGRELLTNYTEQHQFQLLLIDIEMPGESGITIADTIRRTIDHDVIIVFVSNYPKYMQDSFKVHPYHFIQKPVTANEITKLMDDILYDIEYNKSLISIIDGYENEYTLNIDDIYYIETVDAKNKELCFYLHDDQIHAKGILTTWTNLLLEHAFHICSRTVLVNLTHIHYINDMEIVLDNGARITVSRKNKKALLDNYRNKIVAIKRGGLRQ
ncbi:MAG: response regulator transcription factor [Lachnospiraceae bacterium]|nr:response regulator transcription factor [Lachnospiraceae bacterium]